MDDSSQSNIHPPRVTRLGEGVPVSQSESQLHELWRDLVQRTRVHEMVKCLQAEKKKLKILQANLEPDSDFLEFAAKQHAVKRSMDQPKEKSSVGTTTADEASSKATGPVEAKDIRQSDRSSDIGVESGGVARKLSRLDTTSSASTKGTHSHISQARNAAEIISNKPIITDQEFEDIVELCEDKIEQKALREAYEEKKAREKYLHNADERRIMLYNFINSRFFNNFMLVTIITSIVGIFMLTFENIAIRYAWPLIILDSCIIGIFLVEAIVKVTIYKEDYFKHMWNILDMLIIVVHFVEVAVDLITRTLALSTDINANIGFKFLKSLRALRLLRVIKFLPNLQVIVATVFQSMLSIGSIAVLMLLFIFVFAVMGRGLFYEKSPNKFGNLWLSFVTLFQLLTLDDWFKLLDDDNDEEDEEFENEAEADYGTYWLMFGYLFAYLVIEFFVFLNLFVAVLVDNFQLTLADAEIQKQKEALEELAAQKKFDDMKKEGVDPSLNEEEHQRHISELEQLGLHVNDYFPVEPDSKEADLLSDFYKDLNSIDFERFLWKRRTTLFNMIVDTALTSRGGSYSLPSEKENDSEDELPEGRRNTTDKEEPSSKNQEEARVPDPRKTSDSSSVMFKSSVHPSQLRRSFYVQQRHHRHNRDRRSPLGAHEPKDGIKVLKKTR